MRILAAALLTASFIWGADTLSVFGHQWTVAELSDWKIGADNNMQVLQLLHARGPLPGPRRPIQFAIAQTPEFERVSVSLEMRPRGRSLLIVFAYRDPGHFDYAHLSVDSGMQQSMHNGIFHVFGGERVRISSQSGRAAFRESNRWYHAVLKYDGGSGSVQVSVDGQDIPALHGMDLSLHSGKVGLGSFDEVGDFKNVQIDGQP